LWIAFKFEASANKLTSYVLQKFAPDYNYVLIFCNTPFQLLYKSKIGFFANNDNLFCIGFKNCWAGA